MSDVVHVLKYAEMRNCCDEDIMKKAAAFWRRGEEYSVIDGELLVIVEKADQWFSDIQDCKIVESLDYTPREVFAVMRLTYSKGDEWGATRKSDITKLYIMSCCDYVKIGIAGNPYKRRYQIQNGNPFPVSLEYVWEPMIKIDIGVFESIIHTNLKDYHHRGEWFHKEAQNVIFSRWWPKNGPKEKG